MGATHPLKGLKAKQIIKEVHDAVLKRSEIAKGAGVWQAMIDGIKSTHRLISLTR